MFIATKTEGTALQRSATRQGLDLRTVWNAIEGETHGVPTERG